jgi:hypothetical protein
VGAWAKLASHLSNIFKSLVITSENYTHLTMGACHNHDRYSRPAKALPEILSRFPDKMFVVYRLSSYNWQKWKKVSHFFFCRVVF